MSCQCELVHIVVIINHSLGYPSHNIHFRLTQDIIKNISAIYIGILQNHFIFFATDLVHLGAVRDKTGSCGREVI